MRAAVLGILYRLVHDLYQIVLCPRKPLGIGLEASEPKTLLAIEKAAMETAGKQ